jgi:hypothetical protein
LDKAWENILPHLRAAETMVQEKKGFSFPVDFKIDLKAVNRDVWHIFPGS